ncbi:hypothetical protein ABZY44_03320 [Streptomyces sp. NPDC006544]|uniref:hypothetical protein n=1 Tax=Streptomyces sp. NPDC006544 TaxID=3154583 RepID=UPI0033BC21E0
MLMTHHFADGVLTVRLAPEVTIRHRAALTLAVEELLRAHRPHHTLIVAEGTWTPAAFSTTLRAHRAALQRGSTFAVVTAAPGAGRQLNANASTTVPVYTSVTLALEAAHGANTVHDAQGVS